MDHASSTVDSSTPAPSTGSTGDADAAGHASRSEQSSDDDPGAVTDDVPPAEPTGDFVVDVQCEVDEADPQITNWIQQRMLQLAALAGARDGTLSIGIVDDEAMSEYHEQYSGVSGTTDVLTFDLRDDTGDADEPIDGDIVLCYDEAVRQAQARGHDVRLELLLYALHGLLHLQGYDDHDPDAHRLMHEREDELLTLAGLGGVFHRPDCG